MATSTTGAVAKPRYDVADLSIALITGLFLAIIALSLCTVPLAGKMVGLRDFVAYYATGCQLVHHADPYDPGAIRQIEYDAGLSVHGVLLMRNPPWGLPLAFPLGFVGVRIAFVIWSAMVLACLLISARLIHVMHGLPSNQIHWLAFSFTPALMCLNMGQTSLFVLLGLTLFLRYHRTHPFGAGSALWFCTLKPHLLLPFAIVVVAWALYSRSYKIFIGAITAMAASCALTYGIDPSAFTRYLALMRSPAVVQEYVPCLSDTVRFLIRPQAVWLQYLPAALTSIWALWYFWRRRHSWNWIENGSLLILVSLVAAPYLYIYDQCVAIPAVLHGAYTVRNRSFLTALVLVLALIGFEATRILVTSKYYMWVGPIWLVWYLLAHVPQPERACFETAVAQS